MRSILRFYLGDTLHEIDRCGHTQTLLDWLRLKQRQCGTKEGCNEGDCGACTVVVGRLEAGKLVYRAINSCIVFLATLDGCHILTVENLKTADTLHPVQQAMVNLHATQCGFCTPGIVMSLLALWLNENHPTVARIEDVLAGNLCRCTGYRPIVDAALSLYRDDDRESDPVLINASAIAGKLAAMQDQQTLHLSDPEGVFFAPANLDDLASLYSSHPEATLVAGSTDVGLWVTKGMQRLNPIISLVRVEDLKSVHETEAGFTFGAMVSLNTVYERLGAMHPHIRELLRRFGSEQVRNSGTIGGNIANGSPIGDLPPLLIALGASLTLRSGQTSRTIPLETFFINYKVQDRAPSEFVECITVPKLGTDEILNVSKISKRFDEDISALCGAFWLKMSGSTVSAARIAFGGMAATPKRAQLAEQELVGHIWSTEVADRAARALATDFAPLTDLRATKDYRSAVAGNLLRRFAVETLEVHVPTRVNQVGAHNG